MNCGEFIYLCVFLMSGGQVEETNWCSIGSDHCGGGELRMKVKPLIYWSIFVPTLKLASSKGCLCSLFEIRRGARSFGWGSE